MRKTTQVSPLDKLQADIKSGKVAPFYDIEDDDPVLRHRMLTYLTNLVKRTGPDSRLAYQICHFMEANFLEIPGLDEAFPPSRQAFKKEQKDALKKKRELETVIAASRAELRILHRDFKASKGKAIEIEEHIALGTNELRTLEHELEQMSKEKEYKDTYPMSTSAQSRKKGAKPEDWAALIAFLEKKTKKAPVAKDSHFIRNTELLCNHLGFGQAEKDALLLILIADDDAGFNDFLDKLYSGKQKNAHTIIAKMLSVDRDVVSTMFRATSPMVEKGILFPVSDMDDSDSKDDDDGYEQVVPTVSDHLVRVLKEPDLTLDSMMRQFIGEPASTHLDWDKDFAYLGEAGHELIRMLEGAKKNKQVGVNVLLYGEPGTGKTEAMKAAAKKVGLDLYIVGEKTRFGKEPSRKDRISSAILAQELLADKENAAIMLDEMEDLFPAHKSLSAMFGDASNDNDDDSGKELSGASKVYLNRLLENNKTITLWGANRPDKFEAAFRRRVLYSIEFRIPPADVRAKIWGSVSARHNFDLSAADQMALASNFVVPPGLMNNAIRHAAMAGGGFEAIKGNLRAASGLLFGSRRAIDARDAVPAHYDLRFLNTSVEHSDFDLAELAKNIKETGQRDFSMLLFGVPGSGKTEYFAYLADYLQMDVMVRDAASLNDKYVGETEKRIVEAFDEAEERGMFLVIDEADTFLRRRTDLGNNYEVSAVNTMLTCMQHHGQPFGCTTNLYQDIDPAAKRRFLFKVQFQSMSQDQNRLAFAHFFGRDCPDIIRECSGLTPSDFVNVKKQSRFISGEVPNDRLIRMLKLEAKARMEEAARLYAGNDKGFGFGVRQLAP